MPWKKKHRERKSPRLRGWDYGQTATYFITICVKDRKPLLGNIRDGIVGLSHIGLVANWFWLQIPRQFSHVVLDEYIIMPNHLHGILTIFDYRDAINRVPVDEKNNHAGGATGRYNPMLSTGNLGRVVRWYKGRCTYEIHQRNYTDFQWQGRYWDHIIYNKQSLGRIREYIYNNPLQWNTDQFYETR